MAKFVGYFRVATDPQGDSGLGGLGAQREAAERLLASQKPPGKLVAEFTESEWGKRHQNRPQLAAAVEYCRRYHCTLLIAMLDRLGRNLAFISGLVESNINFLAADKPAASRLELHMYAAVAEEERRKISERTRAALAVKRAELAKEGRSSATRTHSRP
jgi:DNA invertase Pin-like site-specific DNA recombinase